jgi:hypothetical protein
MKFGYLKFKVRHIKTKYIQSTPEELEEEDLKEARPVSTAQEDDKKDESMSES